jgi:hypothetical protein
MTQDAPEQLALPAAIRLLAPANNGPILYARGRVVAPWDQNSYTSLRFSGRAADAAAADGQVSNQGTAAGTFTAPWNDSSGRLYAAGSLATVSAADAALARLAGKLDSSVLPPPTVSAVSATAQGGGVVRFNWTTNQVCAVTIQFGPTTAYGTSFSPPAGTGAQTYLYGIIATGLTHYLVTVTSVWGTTAGTDATVTVT